MLLRKSIGKGYYTVFYEIHKKQKGYYYKIKYRNPKGNRVRVYRSKLVKTYSQTKHLAEMISKQIYGNILRYLLVKRDL